MKDAYEDTASPKSFVHQRWEKSWLVCQREEGNANDMYTVAVKTDRTKTVQIKLNNDLLSFQLCLMIDFVLSERKLAHGPIKFPARSIGHTNSTLDTKYHMYMIWKSSFFQMRFCQNVHYSKTLRENAARILKVNEGRCSCSAF